MELTEAGGIQSKEENQSRGSRVSSGEGIIHEISPITEQIEEQKTGSADQDQENKPLLVVKTKRKQEDKLADESLDYETYSPISVNGQHAEFRKVEVKQREKLLEMEMGVRTTPRESSSASSTPARPANLSKDWLPPSFIVPYYIALWFSLSTALSLFNKEMFGTGKGQEKFPAPLMLTTVQFFQQILLAAIGLSARGRSLRHDIPGKIYNKLVVPSAILTSLDIGLSNLSLVHITLSFYTMVKSSAPLFLILFAFAYGIEKPSFRLFSIVTLIAFGVTLTVNGETHFDFHGFTLVFAASIVSGLRWVLTQKLLQHRGEYGIDQPMNAIYVMAPIQAITLGVISTVVEKPWLTIPKSELFSNSVATSYTMGIMVVGAILAFAMVLAEFSLIQATSAVTFTVVGVTKEVVTIAASAITFHDTITIQNLVGFLLVACGVMAFKLYRNATQGPPEKAAEKSEDAEPEVAGRER